MAFINYHEQRFLGKFCFPMPIIKRLAQ